MKITTAIYDANTLYPAPLRDLLIRLAQAGLVQARWTDAIHDECAFVRREIAERNIHSNAARPRGFPQIIEVSSITRLCPRLERQDGRVPRNRPGHPR